MKGALVVAKLDQVAVDIDTTAITERQGMLEAAADITSVSDEFSQACAVDCLRQMNGLLKLVEKSRTEVKAPVLDIGRKIDSLAKNFVEPLSAEVARVNKLVTAYQVAERQKAEAAERARQQELLRIAAEQRAAAEAEANRLKALREAEEAKEAAFTRKEADKAEFDRLRIQAEAEAQRLRQSELERQRLQAQSEIARPVEKPSGLVVKDVWKFEVTDVRSLYLSRPNLCKLDASASAINEAIRTGMRECPGLRIYSETVTGVRA